MCGLINNHWSLLAALSLVTAPVVAPAPVSARATPALDAPTATEIRLARAQRGRSLRDTAERRGPRSRSVRDVTERRSSRRARPARNRTAKRPQSLAQVLTQLRRDVLRGATKERQAWRRLTKLENTYRVGWRERAIIHLTRARLLLGEQRHILAALYARAAITTVPDPLAREVRVAWQMLHDISRRTKIDQVLTQLASQIDLKGKTPPAFGRNWYYFAGLAHIQDGSDVAAARAFRGLKIADRTYLPAKYQLGMLYATRGKRQKAAIHLRPLLAGPALEASPLPRSRVRDLTDYAHLAMARIAYEGRQFRHAIRHYRMVRRDGPVFYDALFEQAWAFFMGGYPNHALGALHGAESPFYADISNPEASMLRSIVYYWLCRYDDSKVALSEFLDKHSRGIEQLTELMDRRRVSPRVSYQLFEDLVGGVSSESLGVPRSILNTAAITDPMLLIRNQFAEVLEERETLHGRGLFGSRALGRSAARILDPFITKLREQLGEQFAVELKAMQDQYQELYDQAQFLYVELLMSEKEQVLGKELHASSKIRSVDMRQNVRGWSRKDLQSWVADDKQEFWWDEVGFYIYNVQSECR